VLAFVSSTWGIQVTKMRIRPLKTIKLAPPKKKKDLATMTGVLLGL
jgi:hypothetical protein